MPITAKFEADFEQFKGATAAAVGTLKGFETSADRAGTSLGQLQARAGGTTNSIASLGRSINDFDHILGVMGIHITPEMRAITELGESAESTAGQLGLVATAGLALGAGIGGWKIGRAIADFFDLDDAIARATAKFLDFGDVAAQVAGANIDKLAEASRRAKRDITDLGEATAILNAGIKDSRSQYEQSASALAVWQKEIRGLRASGDLDQLVQDLASQNFQLDDLAKRYGVHVEALRIVEREQAAAAAATKQFAEDQLKSARDIEQEYEKMGKVVGVVIDEWEADMKHLSETVAKETADQEERLQDELTSLNILANKLQSDLWGAPAQDFGAELQSNLDRFERLRGTSQGYDIDQAQRNLIEADRRRQVAADAAVSAAQPAFDSGRTLPPVSQRAGGGPVRAGQSYIVGDGGGPELFTPGASGFITPAGGPTIYNTFYVNGTVEESGRKLMDYITRSVMRQTQVGA